MILISLNSQLDCHWAVECYLYLLSSLSVPSFLLYLWLAHSSEYKHYDVFDSSNRRIFQRAVWSLKDSFKLYMKWGRSVAVKERRWCSLVLFRQILSSQHLPMSACDQCLCSVMLPVSREASAWRRDWPASCYVSRPCWTHVLLIKYRRSALLIMHRACVSRLTAGARGIEVHFLSVPHHRGKKETHWYEIRKEPVVLWALRGHTYSSVASVWVV